jgi:hypothetical protein
LQLLQQTGRNTPGILLSRIRNQVEFDIKNKSRLIGAAFAIKALICSEC